MSIVSAPRRRAKLRGSGMWDRMLFLPLLRSLADHVACVATNMALRRELSTSPPQRPRGAEDACKVQRLASPPSRAADPGYPSKHEAIWFDDALEPVPPGTLKRASPYPRRIHTRPTP